MAEITFELSPGHLDALGLLDAHIRLVDDVSIMSIRHGRDELRLAVLTDRSIRATVVPSSRAWSVTQIRDDSLTVTCPDSATCSLVAP